jgi:2-dehydropantoate 2-reductase
VIGSSYFAADRVITRGNTTSKISKENNDNPIPPVFVNSWGNRIALASNTENCEALKIARACLLRAGWKVQLEQSQERMLWTKLCFNAATNPLGALCAVNNGQLAEDPGLREIMLKILHEALLLAQKAGHAPLRGGMPQLIVRACREAPKQRNSTFQDLQANRRTEIEAILGPLLAAAHRTKTPAPFLTHLWGLIRRLEKELQP